MKTMNKDAVIKMITKTADVVMNYHPQADYDAEDIHLQVVDQIIEQYGLTSNHVNDLVKIRTRYEKKNKIHNPASLSQAFTEDRQQQLINKKVPHRVRVASGLFDVLVGSLMR